jgi:hypothetical protein
MSSLFSILALFSGPIGQLITSGITAGGAAAAGWMISKGVPADSAAVIVSGIGSAVAALISTFTGIQTVQVQSIRQTQGNGITVVSKAAAVKAGVPSVEAPLS